MNRAIIGFHCDDDGDWVAELTCGHNQHVRHRPPFQLRPWVLDAKGRQSRNGALLNCPLCNRAELPDGLNLVRSSPKWDENTMPTGLRVEHRVERGTWGRIVVLRGQLRFMARTNPVMNVVVSPDASQAIPPDVDHDLQPLGLVQFKIEYFSIPQHNPDIETVRWEEGMQNKPKTARDWSDEVGDPVCWAHLLCPECGTVLNGDLHVHVPDDERQ